MVEHLLRLEEESDSSKELVQCAITLILSRRKLFAKLVPCHESICNKSLIQTNILAVKPSFNSKTNVLRRGVV